MSLSARIAEREQKSRREAEALIAREHKKLVESLSALSRDALSGFERNMAEQMDGIETTARRRIARLEDLKDQITDAPVWSIGTLAAVSAGIAALISVAALAGMIWMGADAGRLIAQQPALRQAKAELMTEITALAGITVQETGTGLLVSFDPERWEQGICNPGPHTCLRTRE